MDSLEKLGRKIKKLQKGQEPEARQENSSSGLYFATEIVAGVAVGGILGYYLDHYLHTKILFLLIFLILGLISSLYNIYKKNK